jgi:hypothetical protein
VAGAGIDALVAPALWIVGGKAKKILTAKNAKNANRSGASEAVNNAFDFQARLAEVQQQAQTQVGRFEVVQTLSKMNRVQFLDRPEFHEHRVPHQQVHSVLTDDAAIIPDDDTAL